jgi:hypothetical protein
MHETDGHPSAGQPIDSRPPGKGIITATPARPDPRLWDEPPMRAALARHDFTEVIRLIRRIGYSQAAIGRLTGQAQPEISAITFGRKVVSYAVIARFAEGLGVPAGYLGVSWCTCPPTAAPIEEHPPE